MARRRSRGCRRRSSRASQRAIISSTLVVPPTAQLAHEFLHALFFKEALPLRCRERTSVSPKSAGPHDSSIPSQHPHVSQLFDAPHALPYTTSPVLIDVHTRSK